MMFKKYKYDFRSEAKEYSNAKWGSFISCVYLVQFSNKKLPGTLWLHYENHVYILSIFIKNINFVKKLHQAKGEPKVSNYNIKVLI